jgi:hypothetical protein
MASPRGQLPYEAEMSHAMEKVSPDLRVGMRPGIGTQAADGCSSTKSIPCDWCRQSDGTRITGRSARSQSNAETVVAFLRARLDGEAAGVG